MGNLTLLGRQTPLSSRMTPRWLCHFVAFGEVTPNAILHITGVRRPRVGHHLLDLLVRPRQ